MPKIERTKKKISSILIFNIALICSMFGFIINGLFLFYLKWLKYIVIIIVFNIIIEIFFFISNIISLLFICIYPYKFSIILLILYLINSLLSISNLAIYLCKKNDIHRKIHNISKPSIVLFIINAIFCLLTFIFWLIFYISNNNIECNKYCCRKNISKKNTNVTVGINNISNNNISRITDTNININDEK